MCWNLKRLHSNTYCVWTLSFHGRVGRRQFLQIELWKFLPFADFAESVLARIRKAALGLRAETDKCVVAAYPPLL